MRARWYRVLGRLLELLGWYKTALAAHGAALALGAPVAAQQLRRSSCLSKLKRWRDAESAIQTAIDSSDTVAAYHLKLAAILRLQGKCRQELDVLEHVAVRHPRHAELAVRLANAREAMGQYAGAAEAYQRAIALRGRIAQWHFRLGHVLQRSGDRAAAQVAFERAAALDATLDASRFGIGVFYEQESDWPLAAEAYASTLKQSPSDAQLRCRLGRALEGTYRWEAAAQAYSRAIALDARQPSWHFRLGFVRERQGDWSGAAEAYSAAVAQKPEQLWLYRLGYVLHRAGRHDAACSAFQGTLPRTEVIASELGTTLAAPKAGNQGSRTAPAQQPCARIDPAGEVTLSRRLERHRRNVASAKSHFLLGKAYERRGMLAAAALEYRAAAARAETHQPNHYFRLGAVLAQDQRFPEACAAFIETRLPKTPSGMSDAPLRASPLTARLRQSCPRLFRTRGLESPASGLKVPWRKRKSTIRSAKYTELYEELPIVEGLALYESFLGASMSGNPLAVFRELLQRQECREWTHVWVINGPGSILPEYATLNNVRFVARHSDGYLSALASAKLLVNDVTFPDYFIRKPGQLYLNTWHGTPIKSLGKDIKGQPVEHKNVARNFLHATHIISPNPHTTRVLLDRYDVAGILRAVVAETGYPRIDATLNATDDSKRRLRERLGVRDDATKVVLYAPTWRGTHDRNIRVDVKRLEADTQRLQGSGHKVVFRGHRKVERRLRSTALSRSMVPHEIDTNELLSVVDILITDYSSIALDFVVTGRPIIYYAYDLEAYAGERGLYFPLSELPGKVCSTIDEVAGAIGLSLTGPSEPDQAAYQRARERFCAFEDGLASRRVVDLVLHDRREGISVCAQDQRTSLLFYVGPLIPNGILSSWRNLIAALDPEQYVVTVVLEPGAVVAYPERMREFAALPPHIQVLGHVGPLDATLEELWLKQEFYARYRLDSEEMTAVYSRMFSREYARVLGGARFDCAIHFEGYNRFWLSVFANAPRQNGMRVVAYQHNDMLGEWRARFPYLEQIFRQYDRFDALVSVSEATRDLNRENLKDRFQLDTAKFVFCENLQNPTRVRALAEEPIADAAHQELFVREGAKFITVGRLSPEKDHATLLDAFAEVCRVHGAARLFILGDGPLRRPLLRRIAALGLSQNVFLLGHRSNPFPYVARSDCFVLSSNHEGQPMVLFEAMILGKPIVARDIVGTRGVLGGRYGLLVENSKAGLAEGMLQFLESRLSAGTFDCASYQEHALEQFVDTVVRGL